MIEFIKTVLVFLNNWANVFLIGVGFIAIWIYHLQKGDEINAAATELKEQILEIEDTLQKFVDNPKDLSNYKLYLLGSICTENLWRKNRTALSRYLNEDDRKSIQTFYLFAERVERARLDAVKCLQDTWYHKSYLQQKNMAIKYQNGEMNEDTIQRMNQFIKDEYVFVPEMCTDILKTAKDFKPLVGTSTYKKLADLSNKHSWLIF